MTQHFKYKPVIHPKPAPSAPQQPASPAQKFVYKPRSYEQWFARVAQTNDAPRPLFCARKATQATPCADCGCRRDAHCLHPRTHITGDTIYMCLTEHCQGRKLISHESGHRACTCVAFRAQVDDVPKFKKPRVDDYTKCVTCGHWRGHHCTARRTVPQHVWESKGLEFPDERSPWKCKHFHADVPYACDSMACADWDENTGEWCPCSKFVSPFASKKKNTIRKPRGKKFQAGTLFPVQPDTEVKSQ